MRDNLTSRIQTLNSDLLVERARMSAVEQRMAETQRACLIEIANQPDRVHAGCTTDTLDAVGTGRLWSYAPSPVPPALLPTPQGSTTHYQQVLLRQEQEKDRIEGEVLNLVSERGAIERELMQHDEQCSQQ